MPKDSLRELYIDELRDLYSAETQLVKALPKMAKAASKQELRQAFEEHLRQTAGHVTRLEQIFEELGEKPGGKSPWRYVRGSTSPRQYPGRNVLCRRGPRLGRSQPHRDRGGRR